MLPTEIGYRTLKILIQYMYSGETTVTNDQLEGVLKAGDILRVRGLWRSNSGGNSSGNSSSSSSRKENIQSNSQKANNRIEKQQTASNHVQKIKLVQPSGDKNSGSESTTPLQPVHQQQQQQQSSVVESAQSASQQGLKTYEKKIGSRVQENHAPEKNSEKDQVEQSKDQEPRTNNCDQVKNKENVETNGKKRKSISVDCDSVKSKSDSGDNVSF